MSTDYGVRAPLRAEEATDVRETLIATLRATIEYSRAGGFGAHIDRRAIENREKNAVGLEQVAVFVQDLPDDDSIFPFVAENLRQGSYETFSLSPGALKRLRNYGVSDKRTPDPRTFGERLVEDEKRRRSESHARVEIGHAILSLGCQVRKLQEFAKHNAHLISVTDLELVEGDLADLIEGLTND